MNSRPGGGDVLSGCAEACQRAEHRQLVRQKWENQRRGTVKTPQQPCLIRSAGSRPALTHGGFSSTCTSKFSLTSPFIIWCYTSCDKCYLVLEGGLILPCCALTSVLPPSSFHHSFYPCRLWLIFDGERLGEVTLCFPQRETVILKGQPVTRATWRKAVQRQMKVKYTQGKGDKWSEGGEGEEAGGCDTPRSKVTEDSWLLTPVWSRSAFPEFLLIYACWYLIISLSVHPLYIWSWAWQSAVNLVLLLCHYK